MNTSRALLYARTLRTLRPAQVLGRVWKALHSPRPDLAPAPPSRRPGPWQPCARRKPSWSSPTRRMFLGTERELRQASDWNSPEASKLWLYNLHYFDDLNAEDAEQRVTWHQQGLERWIEENPPGEGNGWEPYCLSLRIVNWLKWHLAGNELAERVEHSLAVQARFLRGSLEHHLLGNHLFANAKALIFAGCHFTGREAEDWLERGLELVHRELAEQVLPDGGHFERSPMYHSLMLEDLLDLLNLVEAYPDALPTRWRVQVPRWRDVASRMRRWLVLLTHPDGQLALFNDSAFDVAPEPEELHGYARRLGLGPVHVPGAGVHELAHSGYLRVETTDALAILDVGEIGPEYLPGHAHADTLTFELSLDAERVIVNSGTSLYETGTERLRQRSTAAHNTVVVDDQDSSEVWSSFRVARRARPLGLAIEERKGEIRVACCHDGYLRLPGRVLHERRWRFREGELEITDRLRGRWNKATAHLHLHPAVQIEEGGRLRTVGGRTLRCAFQGARFGVEPSTWHPRFGSSLAAQRLRFDFNSDSPSVTLAW